MNFRIILFAVILLLIDLYVYNGLRVLTSQRALMYQRIFTAIYWSIVAASIGILIAGQYTDWHTWPKAFRTYAFAMIVGFYIAKILMAGFLVVDDAFRILRFTGTHVSRLFSSGTADEPVRISRLGFIVQLGAMLSAIPFVSLMYGMTTGGQYRYRVRRVSLKLPNLPPAFEGFKAVQISDLHTGSFLSSEPLKKAVDLIHAQQPDVIFFTGDLVNDRHDEAVEHRQVLSSLHAPHGVYSVLGNHDYGDYYRWNTVEEKSDNLAKLKSLHGEFGWRLLNNDHAFIEKDGEKLGLIGVENWSARMNFHRYGDMAAATSGFSPAPVNILLSHDPSHWHAEITEKYPYVDLMLAGHTHGFQFGVEIPGFRWSPVQYVYKEWADLYQNNNQYLYVNRGLGFIGYPGRVGILPEITVIEFSRA